MFSDEPEFIPLYISTRLLFRKYMFFVRFHFLKFPILLFDRTHSSGFYGISPVLLERVLYQRKPNQICVYYKRCDVLKNNNVTICYRQARVSAPFAEPLDMRNIRNIRNTGRTPPRAGRPGTRLVKVHVWFLNAHVIAYNNLYVYTIQIVILR